MHAMHGPDSRQWYALPPIVLNVAKLESQFARLPRPGSVLRAVWAQGACGMARRLLELIIDVKPHARPVRSPYNEHAWTGCRGVGQSVTTVPGDMPRSGRHCPTPGEQGTSASTKRWHASAHRTGIGLAVHSQRASRMGCGAERTYTKGEGRGDST